MADHPSSPVALITGANKGIGVECVKQLAASHPSWRILLGSRSVQNGQDALASIKGPTGNVPENVTVLQIDVTDKASISKAAAQVKADYGGLDYLVHNSGVAKDTFDVKTSENGKDSFDHKTYENAKDSFDVNVFGVYRVQEAFTPLLRAGGKTVLVGSGAVPISWGPMNEALKARFDPVSQCDWTSIERLAQDYLDGLKGTKDKGAKDAVEWPSPDKTFSSYGISKVLITYYMRYLAASNPDRDVVVVCPGYCATALNGFSGPRPSSKGGESVVWALDHPTKQGAFYRDGSEISYTQL